VTMSDEDDELEELRRRKLLQLQAQQEHMAAAQEQAEAVEAQRQAILRQVLTPEARERLGTVKIAYPDLAAEVERQLILLATSGRLARVVDEATLKEVLAKMMPKKREIKIQRKG
jgi:programmed cell death protein 5